MAGNQGFFGASKISHSKPTLSAFARENCLVCGLSRQCVTPKITHFGEGGRKILIVTDYPDFEADKAAHLLSNRAIRSLRAKLKTIGVDFEKDCRIIGALSCRPEVDDSGKIKEPSVKQVDACRPRLWRQVREYSPEIILLLGDVALDGFLAHRWKRALGNVLKWRGFIIPDKEAKAYVLPLIHPRNLTDEKGNPAVDPITQSDIAGLAEYLNKPFVDVDPSKFNICSVYTAEDIRSALRDILRQRPTFMAFDFETSGIKPHRKGHFIECCAIAYGPNDAVVFPILDEIRPVLARILRDPEIKKIAHGLQFEDIWTREILKTKINGWHWCTKVNAHILDNRDGVTDLKFQAYTHFGVIDYASHLDSYLTSGGSSQDKKDGNSFNTIHLAPKHDLYYYCGQDAVFTYRIGLQQMEEVKARGLSAAYELFHDGLVALCDVADDGIMVDTEYVSRQQQELTEQIGMLETRIWNSKEGRLWKKIYPDKAALDSLPQLAAVLSQSLKTEMAKTEKGNITVDADTLEKIDLPFAKDLLRRRTLKKTRDTFLANISRETVNGILRPFFHLNTTISFRSSSSKINFQNIPVRDIEIMNIVRSAIIPRPGNRLIEIDYSGAEVRVSACAHKDPQMIKYITDPTTDMHRDCAMDIYLLEKDQVAKKTRQLVKGAWTFAQFYGDWYKACAKNLWEGISDPSFTVNNSDTHLLTHLKDRGIHNYAAFEAHLKEVENIFWNKRFKIYTKWKEKYMDEYHTNGYFTTLTGFVCGGVMRKNEALNLPIQGPSFHLLLWGLNRLNAIRKEEGWKSMIIGQIHDSIVIDAVPEEVDHVLKTANRVMTQDIKSWAKWLIVPLEIEAEATGINEPWSKKKGIMIPK